MSKDDDFAGFGDNSNAGEELKDLVERVERLEEEKKQISDDIKDIFAEAKGRGYDAKVMRKVIAWRKRDPDEREEEERIMNLYLEAMGLL